jgi:glycosyltransferase involved in cell wall biosynthesis
MGNMELAKDNVNIIIHAFSIIEKKHPSLKLRLYGSPSSNTRDIIYKQIGGYKLHDKIKLMGKIISKEVPQVLLNAKILVSSQPKTMRASGGFPTKLGEYLLSGVPALLTDVGENASYVQDNIHAFFVEPDNPELYAEKLSKIINNYEESLSIAKNGRDYILKHHSHKIEGALLLDFISNL